MFFYFLFLHSALLDWIMLILVWFERPLYPTQVSWLKVFFEWWNCMMSQVVQGPISENSLKFCGERNTTGTPHHYFTVRCSTFWNQYYNVKIDLKALNVSFLSFSGRGGRKGGQRSSQGFNLGRGQVKKVLMKRDPLLILLLTC